MLDSQSNQPTAGCARAATPLTLAEWHALHDKLLQQAKDTFFESLEEAQEHPERGKLLELHEVATTWFEEQLRSPEGARARKYLTGRGLSAEAIAKFRIGYGRSIGRATNESRIACSLRSHP